MTDLPPGAVSSHATRGADKSGVDLDAQILAAEMAVIERDGRVRSGVEAVKERVLRKRGVAFAVAGGGALLLARLWSMRHRDKEAPAAPAARKSTGSTLLKALAFLLPWLPGAAHRILPGGTSGRLIGLALPMLGQFVGARQTQGAARSQIKRPPVKSAEHIDLPRYLGRWYEVARLPTAYEKRCAADVLATYTQAGQGLISVVNSCRRSNGRMVAARGIARVVAGSGNARLKVSFAPKALRALPFFWADYWVLTVASDYRCALVGTPDRRSLWLLSRTPSLSGADQQRLIDYAREQGYDTTALISTPRLGDDGVS